MCRSTRGCENLWNHVPRRNRVRQGHVVCVALDNGWLANGRESTSFLARSEAEIDDPSQSINSRARSTQFRRVTDRRKPPEAAGRQPSDGGRAAAAAVAEALQAAQPFCGPSCRLLFCTRLRKEHEAMKRNQLGNNEGNGLLLR